MARDEGFAVADVDTSLYEDVKVKRLWRVCRPDVALMTAAMVIYEATRLASWRGGIRVAADDAVPLWLAEPDPAIAALTQAGLLDTDGRIPPQSWSSWYEAAYARREKLRAGWRERKARQRDLDEGPPTNASPMDTPIVPREAQRERPTRPSARPPARPPAPARAHEAPPDLEREGLPHLAIAQAVVQVGEAITGRGLLAAGDRQLTELDRLVERYGPERVVASMRLVAGDDRLEWRQLVWATMKQMEPIPDRVRPEVAKQREADALVARLEARTT